MPIFPRYDGPALIEQIITVENMTRAFRETRANLPAFRRDRSAGPDGVTFRDFEADWQQQMSRLAAQLRDGTYRPLAPKQISIPKRSGGQRVIAIMAICDRIAQRATHQVIGPLFEPYFLDCSFGCRPQVSAADALARVARYAEQGCTWVVDTDVAAYFDSIDQGILMGLVRQRINDPTVLRLIAGWLAAGSLDAPLPGEAGPAMPSLVGRGVDAVRRLFDGAPAAAPQPPMADLDYAAGYWEQPGLDGWGQPYARPPMLPPPGYGARSPLQSLWDAALLARPVLEGARRALPYLGKIGGRPALIAGGVAAGALALYELAARWSSAGPRGAAQGGPLSPLLANIYLHPFDLALTSQGLRLVRFMDDLVVLCASREEAERALRLIERQLATLRLQLNPAKTAIRDYREGLEFLGQSLVPRRRGPRIEDGLASFAEAEEALRGAMRQARQGAARARQRLRRRKAGDKGTDS